MIVCVGPHIHVRAVPPQLRPPLHHLVCRRRSGQPRGRRRHHVLDGGAVLPCSGLLTGNKAAAHRRAIGVLIAR